MDDTGQMWPASGEIVKNERHFREMIDALPVAIYTTDAEGRLTYFNPAAVEFAGREPEPGTDQWCVSWKLYHPDGTPMPHDMCPMAIALKEGRSINGGEAIAERPDGKRIRFEAYPSPLYDGEGTIIGGINMLIDITDRKRDEKQLRRSERELSDFFENATIGLHWVGPDGIILRANQAELDLLGYSRDEYVGRHIADFYPDKDVIDDILRRLKAGEELHDYEARMRCKDGSIKHVLINSNVLCEDGEFIHTRCFTRDVTDRKEAEKNLRSSEERFRIMMEQSPLSMQIFDAEGRTLTVNPAWEHLWGTSREELIDYNILNDKQLEDAGLSPNIREAFAGEVVKLPVTYYDPARIGKTGRDRWLEGYLYPLTSGDGEISEVALVHHDVTERKQAEEKLQTMNETLEERVEERTARLLSYQEQLRSLVSQLGKAEEQERRRLAADLHDNLGQMLAVCKMKLDLLQKNGFPDRAASGMAEVRELMDEAIRYTRELMSDLKPPPELDTKDLKTVVEWVTKKMKKHGLAVTIEDDGRPKPLSEEVRATLLQSVRELLFNVVKHARVDQARLVLSRLDGQVEVMVEDKGKGFDLEGKELVPTEDGGFGLFNIRERIDLLGGSLEIISEPGKGTKAMLLIPVKDTDKARAPARRDNETGSPTSGAPAQIEPGQKIKVLLVDDHQVMREGLHNIIEEQSDLKVIAEASNGKDAVKLARETSPDVVIMDVNMPVMNGIEATRAIKLDAPHVHVIGLSLYDKEDVIQAMCEAGASAYLTKDEAFETLCATIRSETVIGNQ